METRKVLLREDVDGTNVVLLLDDDKRDTLLAYFLDYFSDDLARSYTDELMSNDYLSLGDMSCTRYEIQSM